MTSIAREPELRVPDEPDHPTAAPPNRPGSEWPESRGTLGALLVALAIGIVIRAWHTWGAGFPLNDGGLFYVMVHDLQRAHYHLPAYTSYNGGHIPFAYSPFTFYLTGLLNDATGASVLTLLRVLPFLASTACIAAFALLARAMLASRATIAASLVAFAIVPRGFVWLIMGGGLTRSFGYLFALLALYWIWLLYTRRSLRYVPPAAVCCALTASSHLGTTPFVVFSAALFFLFRGRHRRGVVGSLLIAVGTLLLTAPWWAPVIVTHGLAPFAAARASGGSLVSVADRPDLLPALGRVLLGTTGEGMFPLILILALLGAVWCIRERRALLPLWWLATLVLDTRAGSTYASAPVAMLAGAGAVELLWPLVAADGGGAWRRVLRRGALLVFGVLLLSSIVSAASTRRGVAGETRVLTALTPVDRAPMQWVSLHTTPAARFLVLTSGPWEIDKISEWFPALTQRVSVATVQGTEWLPHGAFERSIRRQQRLTACAAGTTTSCLDSLSMDPALRFTQLYLPNGPTAQCCRFLLSALLNDPRYRVVYAGEGATIFARW